jgi:hypothetical protein
VDLIGMLQRQLAEARQEIEKSQRRIAELEKQLGGAAAAQVDEAYSLRAEEKRQEARRGKPKRQRKSTRRGRRTTAEKLQAAEREEDVFPAGLDRRACWLSPSRPVWRLENGRAVLVAYHIYRGPGNRFGQIPGVSGRGEFGREILVAIAFQVFSLGLSFDKVCLLLNFFQGLQLRKSQVDSLLHQLAREWEEEFDRLCVLLANSTVVHTDETSWSLNSVWAFLSEKARLLFFGVRKDAETLERILDPATFSGIVISDDAAVYANFSQSQKCWAHLLRKAIKLTLEAPDNAVYRHLTDRLLEIYRQACRVQRDGRLSDAGRVGKVAALDDQIVDLCGPVWFAELPRGTGPEDSYRLLCNEVMRLMLSQQLFTFVTARPIETIAGETVPVAGTNNESERTLRNPAMARQTGRANKTRRGTRRQTVVLSVLESLRLWLPEFTLRHIVDEMQRWTDRGRSCFADLMKKLKLQLPAVSSLDTLLPVPGG